MRFSSFASVRHLSAIGCSALAISLRITGAADVQSYSIEKGIQYFQTGTTAPIADANNGVSFEADVKAEDTNRVSSVTLNLPNGSSLSIPPDGADEFKLKKKYDKQTGVDNAFPNGAYVLTVNTLQDGTKTLPLSLTGDAYPNTPRLSNFPATQNLDSGSYFQFTWDAFTAGGAGDFVQLHIDDNSGNKVWETPDLGEVGALDGRALSALLPARTLAAGQTYQANLDFAKAVARDTTTYPGALGVAQYYKRTKFTIVTSGTASHADVKLYTIIKSRRYEQTDLGTPVLQSLKTFDIDADVEASASAAVTKASILLPNGAAQGLDIQSDDKSFQFTDANLSKAGLDASYPNGQYTFQITTLSGLKAPSLFLSGDAYPEAPHITTAAIAVNSSRDWIVTWDNFNGGTADDFTQLHIEDDQLKKVFETPDYGKSGALNGTASQATVPANSLSPGRTYTARVIFQRNLSLDTTSYPGALGVAGYASRTTFNVTTAASAGPPQVAALPFLGGDFQLSVQAPPNSSVRIDASTDLHVWNPIRTNTVPSSGLLIVPDARAHSLSYRFYRAALLP